MYILVKERRYSIWSDLKTHLCSDRAEVILIILFWKHVYDRIERKSRWDPESNLPLCPEEVEKQDPSTSTITLILMLKGVLGIRPNDMRQLDE